MTTKNLRSDNMSIKKIEQESLFTQNRDDLLDRLTISLANATLLFENNFISFDPTTKKELNEFEYHELLFCGSLFTSGLSLDSIKTLLSKLDKPYSYSIANNYFNFLTKVWQPQEAPPDVDELIEELVRDEDTEKLKELKERIEEYLGLDK